ncbi:unnamed protein product [Caenorhabditis angaria]|uniref:CCAAT-binding factor domain-containing protein n=1 Tax=Caenorhabditis angaria TaxID=860376 RepID=A0A9P1MZS9_9PELO|nr:unnamed protein product [Caenorhabditis angaria]
MQLRMDDDEFDAYFENGEGEEDEDEEVDLRENPENANPEYELEREEGDSKSPEEFAKFLNATQFADEIKEYLKTLKFFEKNETTGDIVPTKSLLKTVNGFVIYLLGTKKIQKPVLKSLSAIFGRYDIFHYISTELVRKIGNLKDSRVNAWFNLFNFLTTISHPTDKITKPFFPQFCIRTPFSTKLMKKRKMLWIAADWDKVWMAIMTGTVNSKVSLKLIPYITEHVISKLKVPFKSADFFYKMFEKKDIHAILSLAAIFKLITEHNFEYPKFYEKVYSLMRPSLLYMDHKEKTLTLLDSFLSSTHIPNYIVASFIKRLARCLILAPVDAQEPILGLIRNLLVRHGNCEELVHREEPKSFIDDPFDDKEPELHKTKALDSSLWEMKLLQAHWNQSVRKRAHFIDKPQQKLESYVRFRCSDELFSVNMAKSFGGEDGEAEKYRKLQDGEEDNEDSRPPEPKKSRKKFGKFAAKHEEKEKIVKLVGVNSEKPTSILNRKTVTINVDSPILWKI